MNYSIPEREIENFISVYWQLLRTVEDECCENDMLNQILVDGAYRLLNRAGVSDAKPWRDKAYKALADKEEE